jgi:CHAT domain-containing protein
MTDQSFAIDITALHDDLYRIMVKTLDGEWSVEAISPFERAELRDYLSVLRQRDEGQTPAEEEKIRQYGRKLFDFLIGHHPDILTAYRAELNRVGSYRLFIRLSSDKAGRFVALPWEYIHDPASGFLTLSRQTPVIRWNPDLDPRPPAPLIQPMKVLVVIPSPPNYPRLRVEAEWERLNVDTAHLRETGQLHLERLERPTWTALRRQLRTDDYHILHFVGYTHFDEPGRQGFFALEDEEYVSGSRPISASELGNEIGTQSTVRLIVVNTRVDSAPSDSKAPLAIGRQLLSCGLAGVLTSQFPLREEAESIFCNAFYPPLCEGHPVEAAVNVARRAIADQTSTVDWGMLALFLRAPYGHLFRPVQAKF